MADKKPEDLDRLLQRLVTAGQGAVHRGLEDLASLLEKYQPKQPSYKGPHLTNAEYDGLLERQGGVCAVCGEKREGRLVVDHDHETGKVRGLLCNFCNVALGFFRDDERRVVAAAEYLRAGRTE